MASTEQEVVVLEHCQISPPPGAVAGKSLPLTCFDLSWIQYPPTQSLLFYEFRHTKSHFIQTIVPKFKYSLSLTLQHFFPLAGKLILFPSNSTTKPEIRYMDGDSVSLTFAECTTDFNYLTSKIPRNVTQLFPLVPQLPPSVNAIDSIVAPLLALQVTHFPNYGICVGITNNHVVGDASSIAGFRKAWALITKLGSDGPLLGESLPFYDRNVIKDPKGLYEILWNQLKKKIYQSQGLLPSPSNMVRASFVISPTDILQLKKLVLAQRTKLVRVSSFVVVCAYVWSCMVKLRAATMEEMHEDELEYMIFPVNCRARLDPPIPPTYFGNCLAPCIPTAKSTQLMGEEGFLIGAELIGEAINEVISNEEGVLKGAEMWFSKIEAINMKRLLGVTGSPKFSLHDIDFGWGIPKKFEHGLHQGSMSLNGCKETEGGLEVGLSLPNDKMNAFANIFADGLKIN